MTPEEWEKVSEIYHAASELDGEARTRFLDSCCDGDETLRREVESLLAADREAGNFISEPVVGAFAADLLRGNGFAPGESIGHYRIVSKLGTGGMGEVFLADDTKLGRQVAIKTLSSMFDGDESFLKRFRNEARAAASLNHPHVATVYSVEEHAGRPFIALEYIDGRTLDELIPAGGVDIETFARWFVPVATALAHAHHRGVIHRDVKPGNIMITRDGIVKILDFGLAYFRPSAGPRTDTDTELTAAGQLLGTPSYMSPEQARGEEVDHRSDIFSLGVVMYEAITGQRPFRGDSNAEIVSNLLKTEPRAIERILPTVPPELSALIAYCLQKRRRDRPQDMDEVREVLERFVVQPRSTPSNRSLSQRFYRQVTSGRVWPNLVGAAVVLVVALAGWLYFSNESKPPIDFDRMTMRRLSDTNNVGYAQISPDGKSIAFATFEDDGTRTLWFRRIDDRNALRILTPERLPFWGGLAISEDGGYVYYITAERTALYGTLYRVSSLGGPPRKLVDQANDVGDLSPDGSRLLFVRYGEPARVISVNSGDGSDERVIVEEATGAGRQTYYRDPKFAPDGKSVFYISAETADGIETWSVESVGINDRTVRRIYQQRDRISEIAPLRNADGLLMTATDPGTNLQQLYYLSTTDGKKTRVTNDLYLYFGVSVDRDGRNIVASQRSDQQRLWVGESSDLSALKPLNSEPRANRSVEWTPDGRIVFDGFENNMSDIWIADADGRNLQKLTDADGDDVEPEISGDGRFIVFTSRRSGRNQVWRMELDGSNQAVLADVDGVTQGPRFAPDGRTVVFEWVSDRGRVLGSVDVYGGPVSEVQKIDNIPGNSVFYWAASPNAKHIAYSVWDATRMRMMVALKSIDGSEPVRTLDIWPSLILKWGPDGKTLYYRERQVGEAPENEVRVIDTATGRSSVLVKTSPEYVSDLAYSRDGKRVAVVRGSSASNVVILTAVPAKQ